MQKILWINSNKKIIGAKEDDGLKEVNEYLANGWIVKHISACSMGDTSIYGQAYVVIEKND